MNKTYICDPKRIRIAKRHHARIFVLGHFTRSIVMHMMINTQVPICPKCGAMMKRELVMRDDYKGHMFKCLDCHLEAYIISEGQAENELLCDIRKGE